MSERSRSTRPPSDLRPRPHRSFALLAAAIAVALTVFGVLVPVSPVSAANGAPPDPPAALPLNATDNDLKWQPDLDYDTDSCYNVPAIGPTPTGGMDPAYISYGLDHNNTTGSDFCHDKSDLDNTNAYSRQRCNSGWCVYLYDYYFEKDVAVENVADCCGHTHDWEHIAVWVQNDQAQYVAASQHGHYDVRLASDVLWDGTHPKLVYDKDGGATHFFRYANAADDPPENYYHTWRRSTLVSYNGFPGTLRDQLFAHDFGDATIAIKDSTFGSNLEHAMPTWPTLECTPNGVGGQTCVYVPTPRFPFDYNLDADGSPGTPPVATPPPPPPTSPPLKVMVVGDSMTQGEEGDWTWRYRLWEWFHDHGVKVDFVGPYTGTLPPEPPLAPQPPAVAGEPVLPSLPRTWGGYASGSWPPGLFDSDHFSVWGRQLAQDKGLIRDEVQAYQPDILLVGLGFNDMGWFISDAAGTLASMKTFVDEARAAKPNIKFALANVPQRTAIGGREDLPIKTNAYNQMLKDAIPTWSTQTSPIKLVDWRANYSCETTGCPAGYDGLHPNAYGEYEIAHAFELTLHFSFGLGDSVPAVPAPGQVPVRPTPVPAHVSAASAPDGVVVTWDAVYGARGYTVRSRVVGSANWAESRAGTTRFDTTWTVDGINWEYQVRTDNGDTQSDWSPVVQATAHPQTAPAPVGIVTHATATGVDVTWGRPTGPYTDTIDRYQVITWDQDIPGAYIGGTTTRGLSVHIDGLVPGHRYTIAVASWNAAGGSIPGTGRPVVIGAGTPAAPTGLDVATVDATTIELKWPVSAQAAGYRVWVRNLTNGEQSHTDQNIINGPTYGVAYLYPGVWNYEFCLTAINGDLESGKSNCVVPIRPPGS